MSENKSKQPYIAILIAIVFLAVGIAVLVLTRHVAKIRGDAVLVALLLIPILVYLAIMGKLKGFTIGPLSASFIESKVEDIKKTVSEIGEYEEERSTYLGKLNQILEKSKTLNRKISFCLIYADVDFLRQHSRKIFLEEKKSRLPTDKRKSEDDIREGVIKKLGYALADAFCEEGIRAKKNKKYDIFYLEEPDIAMIARDSNVEEAKAVAKRSQKIFKHEGYSATIAIVSSDEMKDGNPRVLDKIALSRLSRGKEHKRGQVYTVTIS